MKTRKKNLEAVHKTVRQALHKTPVLQSKALNQLSGAQLFFKCENFQKTGSFKARGAYYSLACLTADERKKGVATHSSGNHGQALAWAAQKLDVPAYIVMPRNAPRVKVAAVKAYGGQVLFCTPNLASRKSELEKVQKQTGAVFIPPYDYENTILGQSTCAQELLSQVPHLQAIFTPVGGGGLAAGTCLAAKHCSSGLAVFGAEPEGADDAYRSLKSGVLVTEHQPHTFADGLLTTLGELNFAILKERMAELFLASDAETLAAMQLIYERLKIVIEPSCAVPLAALLKNKAAFKNKRVGIILSGGNVDLASFFGYLQNLKGI
jgi:threonine dehydratase